MYSREAGDTTLTALFPLGTTVSFAPEGTFSSDSAVDAAGDPYFPLLEQRRAVLILPFGRCGVENHVTVHMCPAFPHRRVAAFRVGPEKAKAGEQVASVSGLSLETPKG
jgi:hypothetical protein